MANFKDDVVWQARQGSVAAIIQVLNARLAQAGLRTRAILNDGVLQLLCESPVEENLDQSLVVEQIKQILESISPRYIRRVKINSRIKQEKQLLWLDEIKRDPQNQLLWSKEITLRQPNLWQWLAQEFEDQKSRSPLVSSTSHIRSIGNKNQILTYQPRDQEFRRGIISGMSISLALLLLAWGLLNLLNAKSPQRLVTGSVPAPTIKTPTDQVVTKKSPLINTPSPLSTNNQPSPITNSPSPSNKSDDEKFVLAVRLAQEAVKDGEIAQTAEEWKAIADKWREASNLMAGVSSNYPRYLIAQDRMLIYQQNSETAAAKSIALSQE